MAVGRDARPYRLTLPARFRSDTIVLPRLEEGFRLARWLTGNATDAEDVIQEACLRAWRAIDSAPDAHGRAWFLVIVRHTCYSWLKRHKPRALVSSEDLNDADRAAFENGSALGPPMITPETALIVQDRARTLASAIDQLSLPLRETLVLRDYHGLSYREIASASGVPIGTVMSRLARARRQVLSAMGDDA